MEDLPQEALQDNLCFLHLAISKIAEMMDDGCGGSYAEFLEVIKDDRTEEN